MAESLENPFAAPPVADVDYFDKTAPTPGTDDRIIECMESITWSDFYYIWRSMNGLPLGKRAVLLHAGLILLCGLCGLLLWDDGPFRYICFLPVVAVWGILISRWFARRRAFFHGDSAAFIANYLFNRHGMESREEPASLTPWQEIESHHRCERGVVLITRGDCAWHVRESNLALVPSVILSQILAAHRIVPRSAFGSAGWQRFLRLLDELRIPHRYPLGRCPHCGASVMKLLRVNTWKHMNNGRWHCSDCGGEYGALGRRLDKAEVAKS